MANPFNFGTVEDEPSLKDRLVSGVKNIFNFAKEKVGRATIMGAPIAPLAKLTKDVGQGILRQGASAALTAVNKPELSFPNDPELDNVVRTIFGEKPKSFATRIAEKEIKAKELGAGKASLPLAGAAVAAGIALDFTGFGGESKAISALAKADKAEDVLSVLARLKVPAKEAEALTEPLRLAKTTDEVEAILKEAKKATEAILPQSQLLKAESAPLSEAGQAGREVPESIHGSGGGSFDGTMPEHEASVNRLLTALKEAGPIRKAQEAGYSVERGKRIAAARAVRENVKGEAGLYAELSKLKGELPKEAFESLRGKINQTDIDNFFDMVTASPKLGDFDKINARQGLAKMFGQMGGQVPTESELSLLGKVFPQDVIKELLDKRPIMSKVGDALVDILNIPRAVMSSFDLSAPFRQGIFMIGKPKRFFGAFKDMFKSFGSEKAYRALMDGIETRPSYQLMRDARLAVTDLGQVTQREEQFLSNFAERIPLFGKLVRASGRAYTGFLSKVRADVFDDLVAKATALGRTPKTDPKLIEDIAKFVNSGTGRGSLGALERSAKVMNAVFFSPRLMASRVNLLNPRYYMKLDPFVRKEAIKTLLTDTSIAMTVLGLAKMGGASVGVDPRNADFGKIKVGNTRFDVMGGFQQYLRLGAQLISGQLVSSTTGKVMTLGEGYKPLTRLDILERFFLGKENPIASYITSALQGEDLIGTKFEPGKEVVKRFIPMLAQDAAEAMKEWGVGKGALISLPSIFGFGVQTYKSPPKSKKSNPFNI